MRLPVTILGGYLGAGKTTLVNHVLRNADGLRLAVLVNDFGALPIDADLIEAEEDGVISLSGGCVCCSFGGDLSSALMRLGALSPAPDHVLIECSGVALPGSVAFMVEMTEGMRLDGVVTLADAERVRDLATDGYVADTVRAQLMQADILVLNKCDLVEPSALAQTRIWLGDVTDARVLQAREAAVPPSALLGALPVPRRGHRLDHGHADAFRSCTLTPPPGDPDALARELATGSFGVIRAKGYVQALDGGTHLVQIVGRRWRTSPAKEAAAGLVCIGTAQDFAAETLGRLGRVS
ncbi:CobW family GTP-binding protein [Falsirhodobacter algicola]|uniref:GTP-binding protein n=1 Tax=Falsirhodobacter algicola TaxID=2692330 RepID=A0A8J8SLF9_9RHOB|nr:CobW family GTP-binding protein [Falsirhodobacter algicola]QUS36326.1 GTP-binding protein [Falsirhodobacter algicola]